MRQRERETAPLAGFALQPDLASLLLHQTPGYGEPEPGAFLGCSGTPFDLPEFFEDHLLIRGADAYAGVGHRQGNRSCFVVTSNFDVAVFRCELDRIAEQVIQNLFETDPIGIDGPICFQLLLHLNILGHGEGTNCRKNFGQSIADDEVLAAKFELSSFDL